MKKHENKAKITIYVDEKKEIDLKNYFENKNKIIDVSNLYIYSLLNTFFKIKILQSPDWPIDREQK